jgi:hypothetical protein
MSGRQAMSKSVSVLINKCPACGSRHQRTLVVPPDAEPWTEDEQGNPCCMSPEATRATLLFLVKAYKKLVKP